MVLKHKGTIPSNLQVLPKRKAKGHFSGFCNLTIPMTLLEVAKSEILCLWNNCGPMPRTKRLTRKEGSERNGEGAGALIPFTLAFKTSSWCGGNLQLVLRSS